MKWVVIGRNVEAQRFEILSDHLNFSGVDNTLTVINVEPEEFSQKLEQAQKEFSHIRIDSPYGTSIVDLGKGKTIMVEALQAADTMVIKDGTWWLNACTFYGINSTFSKHGIGLDLNSEVLVVGAGASARLAIAAAVRAGFNHIAIASRDLEKAKQLVTILKRRFFGVNFRPIPQDQLVLLPGTCGLVINTTPLVENNELLEELYYLNFLRPDGMIWDLVLRPATTNLIRGGEQIGVRCVRGFEIAALSDWQWLKWIAPEVELENPLSLYQTAFGSAPEAEEVEKSRTLG